MALSDAKRAWTARVLDVTAPAQQGGADDAPQMAARWAEARQKLDQADAKARTQIDAVRKAMRQDPGLGPLADFTLDGSDAAFQALMKSLPTAPPPANGAAELERSVAAFRKALEADQVLAACEDNPLDVPVAIRRQYTVALNDLQAALAPA